MSYEREFLSLIVLRPHSDYGEDRSSIAPGALRPTALGAGKAAVRGTKGLALTEPMGQETTEKHIHGEGGRPVNGLLEVMSPSPEPRLCPVTWQVGIKGADKLALNWEIDDLESGK